MKIFKSGINLSYFALGILVSGAASAQTGGTVTYGPLGSTAVPALSGSLLIVLAIVMAVVALRLLKSRPDGRLSSWIVAIGAVVLVSTLGGVKLISDAYAVASVELTNASGGQVTVGEGTTVVENTSSTALQILSLTADTGCSFIDGANGGAGAIANGGGGAFQGTCKDSPSTKLEPADYCEVFVSCLR